MDSLSINVAAAATPVVITSVVVDGLLQRCVCGSKQPPTPLTRCNTAHRWPMAPGISSRMFLPRELRAPSRPRIPKSRTRLPDFTASFRRCSLNMKTPLTIGEYLIQRLYANGVRHVFGIPGDYVLGFYDQLARSRLRLINTCDEQGAGFAADAYARVKGLGAVCVTYCVGGLKVANTTAEAFAEKSPVVVISGAPGMKEREKNPLLHHKVREFDTQKRVFDQLTVASTVLSDPQTAFQEIDRVLHTALRFKRPVYIELPRDRVLVRGNPTIAPRRFTAAATYGACAPLCPKPSRSSIARDSR